MATWNSRGLRGSVLEELINYANQKYKDKDLALIQKIPTPITPVRFDKESRHITLAYFEKKSTVDYIGAVQGIPVCFDAKECAADTFSLQNLHPHQVEFMKNFEKQNGISFLLIYYTHRQKCYYLRFSEMMKYWERMEQGGPKNFKYEELLKQRDVYRNSEKIYSNLNSAYQNLYDGSVNSVDLVGNAVKELSLISQYDKTLSDYNNDIERIMYELQDISHLPSQLLFLHFLVLLPHNQRLRKIDLSAL